MKTFVLIASLLLSATVTAQETTDESSDKAANLSSLRRALMCNCGCSSMTIQDCLAGMQCGTSPALSKEIEQLVKSGKNREQVLDAMVAKYGEVILSAPTKKGFNLSAWILPFLALILGVWAAVHVARKWKRQSRDTVPLAQNVPQGKTNGKYDDRFEKEFRKFNS